MVRLLDGQGAEPSVSELALCRIPLWVSPLLKGLARLMGGKAAVLWPLRSGRTTVLWPLRSGRTAVLWPLRSGRTAVLWPLKSGRTAVLWPLESGRTAVLWPLESGTLPMILMFTGRKLGCMKRHLLGAQLALGSEA